MAGNPAGFLAQITVGTTVFKGSGQWWYATDSGKGAGAPSFPEPMGLAQTWPYEGTNPYNGWRNFGAKMAAYFLASAAARLIRGNKNGVDNRRVQ